MMEDEGMFRTTLHVAHVDRKNWRLTKPLIWEGRWEFFIIRSDFRTDFASIPKPVRWLLDNAGRNAEAAVLHDAVWRESKRMTGSRVDPWHADGVFRRALRQTGAPVLTRSLMWFAVRSAATVSGRFGKGPKLSEKLSQLFAILLLGTVSALVPTVIAAGWIGRVLAVELARRSRLVAHRAVAQQQDELAVARRHEVRRSSRSSIVNCS